MAIEHLRNEMLAWDNAMLASDSGDLRGSLRLFESIADNSKILVNMALLHDRLGARADAIHGFTKAIELDKYLAIAYFQRGVIYFYGEQYAEALKDFSESHTMLRGNYEFNYEPLGLDYRLKSTTVLFNKWLTLSRMRERTESTAVLKAILEGSPPPEMEANIANAMNNSGKGCDPYSLPVGTLYRPSDNVRNFLNSTGQVMDAAYETPARIDSARTRSTLPSLRTASSVTSSTFLPSVSSHKGYPKHEPSTSSSYKSSPLSSDLPDMSSVVHVPKRVELNRAIGPDMMKPMTDIHTIPCAGVRIAHGPMTGLMAWRFVVQLGGSGNRRSKQPACTRPAVITNFILDTGNDNSYVPAETLVALDYGGNMTPGTEVMLLVQGVKTKCIIAQPDDAGRVGLSFMTAGSLTYYFDAGLVAPVLYDGSHERPAHVPRTIRAEDLPRRPWFASLKTRILSVIRFSRA